MKKTFKAITISTSFSIQIALFLISLLIIFALSYILGHQYLRGNSLMGNDTFSFFTIAFWIEKYFPYVPYWFPLQGGGISFSGYPWFAAYFVNIIAYLTPLNLVQSFRILGFLSVPLTGVGIFVLAWTRLMEIRNVFLRQLIGLLAAGFYVIAPVSWIWLMQWGFYAEQVSLIFVPWVVLFMDLFLSHLFLNKYGFLFRIGIIGTIFFALIGFLTHFYVGVTSLFFLGLLTLIYFISVKENKIKLFKRVTPVLLVFVLLFSGAIAFRYYSYSHYMKSVAQGGMVGGTNVASNKEGTAQSLLTSRMMLSLEKDSTEKLLKPRDTIKNMRFPFYVWVLLIPTLVFGLFRSKRMFAFAVIGVIGFIANTNIDAYILFSSFPVLNKIPILNQIIPIFTGRQFFVLGRIIIPLAAAYGSFVFWDLLVVIITRFGNKLKIPSPLTTSVGLLFCTLGTLATVGFLVYSFYNLPYERGIVNAGALESEIITANSGKEIIKVKVNDIWGRANRPNEILTSNYNYDEEQFLKSNSQYAEIADYVMLGYLCSFEGVGIPTTNIYPDNHLCQYYINRRTNPKMSLFAPLDKLLQAQKDCRLLLLSEFIGINRYCQAFYPLSLYEQLALKNWPKNTISSEIDGEINGLNKFFSQLPKQIEYRYDISGYSAKTIMSTPLVNSNSQIQVYINTLSLLHNLANYQSQIMYSVFPLYQTPGVLTEIGKWFGIEYVYLSGTPLEPHEYWNTDINWEKVPSVSNSIESKEENINEGWRKFNLATGLTTWDTRPKVLVISNNSKFFYDESFRFFTRGALLYTDAIPVMGRNAIDYYSYDELKEYEAVFMRGYDYRLKWNAYRLLDRYVKNGGKLIFDTGWQYYVPDYQIDKAPAFMPFDNLTWENLSVDSVFKVEDTLIAKDVDVSKIGDLKYENGAWGVSVPGRMREWGNTVLSYDDKPLVVAGEYGKGKVIWIGFNIIPHQMAKESSDELLLFRNLMQYALSDLPESSEYQLQMNRITPDKIEFTLRDSYSGLSNIYFREAYFPDWKAKLISDNKSTRIKVARAGPGFMLLQLPAVKSGDKVVLEIEPSIKQKMMNMLAILTFLGLLLYLIKPGIYKGIFIKARKIKIPILIKINPFSKIFSHTRGKILHASKWDSDENDY